MVSSIEGFHFTTIKVPKIRLNYKFLTPLKRKRKMKLFMRQPAKFYFTKRTMFGIVVALTPIYYNYFIMRPRTMAMIRERNRKRELLLHEF